jgi:uncharacterized protein
MDKLPNLIPIFPLTGVILLPKGFLPLNIFETRYLDMVEHAKNTNGIIGMVQSTEQQFDPMQSDLTGTAKEGRPLYNIGCAGLISDYEINKEGHYIIILTGLRRFHIINEIQSERSFRTFNVSYENYNKDGDGILINEKPLIDGFTKILKNYLTKLEIDVNLLDFEGINPEEYINAMAMICPFDAGEKQMLLEIPTLTERVNLMIKIMELNISGQNTSLQNNIH